MTPANRTARCWNTSICAAASASAGCQPVRVADLAPR
jgi:hypothetical protein